MSHQVEAFFPFPLWDFIDSRRSCEVRWSCCRAGFPLAVLLSENRTVLGTGPSPAHLGPISPECQTRIAGLLAPRLFVTNSVSKTNKPRLGMLPQRQTRLLRDPSCSCLSDWEGVSVSSRAASWGCVCERERQREGWRDGSAPSGFLPVVSETYIYLRVRPPLCIRFMAEPWSLRGMSRAGCSKVFFINKNRATGEAGAGVQGQLGLWRRWTWEMQDSVRKSFTRWRAQYNASVLKSAELRT